MAIGWTRKGGRITLVAFMLDLTPLCQEEWGEFDGNMFECQYTAGSCHFRWFIKDQYDNHCPACGLRGFWVKNADGLRD